MPQDPVERIGFPEEELQRKAPLTFSFLKKFEKSLRARSGFKKYFKSEGPFYSIYNISEATFAPHKVVWRDMGSRIQAAVVSLGDDDEIIVPEHHVMFVPARSADEAHFLCGLLNSAPVALAVAAYTTTTGMSTHVASVIALPKYSRNDGDHKALGDLARKCAKATKPEELSSLEKDIDIVAARIFSISANELSNVHRALH